VELANPQKSAWLLSIRVRRFVVRHWAGLAALAAVLAIFAALVAFKLSWGYDDGLRGPATPAVMLASKVAHDLNWEAIGGLFGMVLAGLAILIGIRERTRQEQVETYQKLEFASIDLFRWEIEHLDLVRRFRDDPSKDPPRPQRDGTTFDASGEEYALTQYGCQVMNLFEVALRLHEEGTMPREVLGSWAIWMWDFITTHSFARFWAENRENYVNDVRQLFDSAVTLDAPKDNPEPFFHLMGGLFDSEILADWYRRSRLDDGAVGRLRARGTARGEALAAAYRKG